MAPRRDTKRAPATRAEASEQRRQAILAAGLDVFAAQGFAAARLDDVALKAGVAKGTIYLFFADKEDLFEQIVIGAAAPILERVKHIAADEALTVDAMLAALFELFCSQILGTKRAEIIRLVITEGARFPRIAEFYHRQIIGPAMAVVRQIARRARKRGELVSDTIEQFPHLVFAPLIVSLLWERLFSRVAPLDVEGLLAAHRNILAGTAVPRRRRAE